MKNMLLGNINHKLIRWVKTSLNKLNNNIDKDYETTNRNISSFS